MGSEQTKLVSAQEGNQKVKTSFLGRHRKGTLSYRYNSGFNYSEEGIKKVKTSFLGRHRKGTLSYRYNSGFNYSGGTTV